MIAENPLKGPFFGSKRPFIAIKRPRRLKPRTPAGPVKTASKLTMTLDTLTKRQFLGARTRTRRIPGDLAHTFPADPGQSRQLAL